MAYRRTHQVDTAIVRIFNTHGPRMRPNDGRAIPTFATQALTGKPITVAGDGSQTRSIIYVDDLIAGILKLLRSNLAGPVNIGNPHETSVLHLAETIKRLTASSSEIVFIERPTDDPTVRQPDITLAQTELGWAPKVGYEEGLEQTLAYFRSHPELACLWNRAQPAAPVTQRSPLQKITSGCRVRRRAETRLQMRPSMDTDARPRARPAGPRTRGSVRGPAMSSTRADSGRPEPPAVLRR